MTRLVATVCLLAGLATACGGNDDPLDTADEVADSTSTSTSTSATQGSTGEGDDSFFGVAPVLAVSAPPCGDDASPSADGLACFVLGEQVLGEEHVADAEPDEYEVFDCPEGELVCFETGTPDATDEPSETAWAVSLTLSDDGLDALNAAARPCFDRLPECPTGQLALILDGVVTSAPEIHQPEYTVASIQLADGLNESDASELAGRFG